MSWHYLQGQEEVSSEAISWDGERFAPSKSKTILGEYCSLGSGTELSPGSRSGTTCVHLMGDHGAVESMLSAADSHVRTSAQQVAAGDLPDHVRVLSLRCSELLTRFGLRLCSRKTLRTFVPRGWPSSSRSLSAWGMWDESGYWELGTSVRTIKERGCGSLLPTPTAQLYGNNMGGAAGRKGKVRPSLESLTGGVYPALREWMMGWPIGWTELKPLATGRFQEWLRLHGEC